MFEKAVDVTARDRDVSVMNTIDAALGLDRLVCKESYNEIVKKYELEMYVLRTYVTKKHPIIGIVCPKAQTKKVEEALAAVNLEEGKESIKKITSSLVASEMELNRISMLNNASFLHCTEYEREGTKTEETSIEIDPY